MSYIDLIKETRKRRNVSQKQMAELLGTTQQQYSKYEKLQQELPIRHLITICDYFDISADWVLGRSDRLSGIQLVEKVDTNKIKGDIITIDLKKTSKD